MLGNSRKLCIGGFSQGGVMALRVGLEYDQPLGGIFCYSGFYSCFTKPSIFNQGTPIYIQHGKKDDFFEYEKALDTYKYVKENGRITLNLNEKGGHNIEIKGIVDLMKNVDKFVGKTP